MNTYHMKAKNIYKKVDSIMFLKSAYSLQF